MAHLPRILALLLGLLVLSPAAFAQTCPQPQINAQTGTTYTVLNSDNCKKVSLSNGSAVAVTLPQAGSNGNFKNTWSTTLVNLGAGNVTITPTTSTIDGRASFVLQQGGGVTLTSNGTNYISSGLFPALNTSGIVDSDQLPTATASIKGAVIAGTGLEMGGTGNKTMSVTANVRTAGVAVPVCPAGVGCPTSGTPDIYVIPFSGTIAANFTPLANCRVSPAASTTVVVKKWTAGNPATSSTICTTTLSTACSMSACSSSATSVAAGNGVSVEATQASADATAVIGVTVPIVKD